MHNTLEMLDVDSISVESNIGFNRHADDELLNSISVHGVISPITVRLVDGVPVVVAGHRRLNAVKRLGLAQIPAMVLSTDGASDASLLAMQVAENITRANLTPVEELEAYQSVLELVSDEEASELLSKPLQKMQGVRAVMHSEKAQRALENVAGLDLFTAAELAGLEADPDVPAELVDKTLRKLEADPAKAQHLVAELQAQADKLRELSATVARLEKSGLKVVTPDLAEYWKYQYAGTPDFKPLSRLVDGDEPVTLESHSSCGGHVAAVFAPRRSGEECEIYYGCSDWETWGHEEKSGESASRGTEKSAKDAAIERAEDADYEAYDRACVLRTEFIKNLLSRLYLPDGYVKYMGKGLLRQVIRDQIVLRDFFNGMSIEEVCTRGDRMIRLLVAHGLMDAIAASMTAFGYRGEDRVAEMVEALRWLAKAGYELAPIEEEIVSGTYVKPADRDWSGVEA